MGATGVSSGIAASMILALLAVAAKVMAFSSRFCNNIKYKPALISC
ncbi:secreted protein [gut metagenome]|uniref:Secreted protein n=1 Tax=gut metagenome TaxID=749906 RepID=J9FD67_9ZZZZ